jgi:hypothetical protein
MRRLGFDVSLKLLVEEQDVDYLKYVYGESFGNPGEDEDAEWVVCAREGDAPDRDLAANLRSAQPDLVLAVGVAAARRVVPHLAMTPMVLWSVGSLGGPREVFEKAALILGPSPDSIERMRWRFPRLIGKIHPVAVGRDWLRAEIASTAGPGSPWTARRLDVVFAAAFWDGRPKDLEAVVELSRRLSDLELGLVGEAPHGLSGIECYGLVVDRARYLSILGDARLMVCPSSSFSSCCLPLEEAAAMGCRLVCTPSCGNRGLLRSVRVAVSAAPRDLERAIRIALESEPPPREPAASEGFDDLMQILAVV